MNHSTIRQPGEAAPPLAVHANDGSTMSLEDMLNAADGALYLYWIKTGCPTCRLAAPYIDRLARMAPNRVRVVSQDATSTLEMFQREHGLTPLYSEPEPYEAADQYGLTHVPTWFVIERGADGNAIVRESGMAFSQRALEAHHESLGGRGSLFTDEELERLPQMQPG